MPEVFSDLRCSLARCSVGTVGTVAHHFLPAYTATAGAYALVGMGAVFAGIVRAPMTSVLMIFEMTQDYAVIVPLMIANLVSLFIASRLQPEPIYEALSSAGRHTPAFGGGSPTTGKASDNPNHARSDRVAAKRALRLGSAVQTANSSKFQTWLVLDSGGVVGVINRTTLEQEFTQDANQELRKIVDVA